MFLITGPNRILTPLDTSKFWNFRNLIFARLLAGRILARRRRKILVFQRGDPLESAQFWCFAGLLAGPNLGSHLPGY